MQMTMGVLCENVAAEWGSWRARKNSLNFLNLASYRLAGKQLKMKLFSERKSGVNVDTCWALPKISKWRT